jgi:hypothetical protein
MKKSYLESKSSNVLFEKDSPECLSPYPIKQASTKILPTSMMVRRMDTPVPSCRPRIRLGKQMIAMYQCKLPREPSADYHIHSNSPLVDRNDQIIHIE